MDTMDDSSPEAPLAKRRKLIPEPYPEVDRGPSAQDLAANQGYA
jgi:hypothetical protein